MFGSSLKLNILNQYNQWMFIPLDTNIQTVIFRFVSMPYLLSLATRQPSS